MSILDRQILNITIPSIVSNITVPLLGLVDLAIVGHLGATAYIAAISLGGMVFNLMYWIFAFLRMGSSGLTAQAFGRNDKTEAYQLLIRVLVIAFAISFILLVAQRLVFDSAMTVMKPEVGVRELVNTYFTICIWGAPPSLCLFAVSGWFLGMQDSRSPMFVAIFPKPLLCLHSWNESGRCCFGNYDCSMDGVYACHGNMSEKISIVIS